MTIEVVDATEIPTAKLAHALQYAVMVDGEIFCIVAYKEVANAIATALRGGE